MNDAQNTTDTYSYEAFGNLMSSTGTTANPYKYVGSLGYYQTGSSLQHLGARYYMPEVGRFVQRDPLRIAENLLPYAYAGNSPVNYVDPFGLDYTDFCVSGGAWVGGCAGVMMCSSGNYEYHGFGFTTPGVAASLTWSPLEPSPGYQAAMQLTCPKGTVQIGWTFGEGPFCELGAGYGFGISAMCIHVDAPGPKPNGPCLGSARYGGDFPYYTR